MAQETCVVTTGNHDWDDNQSGGTTINALFNNALSLQYDAYARLDCSAIPDNAVITAATLHWYDAAYSKSRSASVDGYISMKASWSAPVWTPIYSFTSAPTTPAWNSHALTSGEFSLISVTGDTFVLFAVNDPGSTYYQDWDVGAYESIPGTSAYLVVSYDLPVATADRRIFIIV